MGWSMGLNSSSREKKDFGFRTTQEKEFSTTQEKEESDRILESKQTKQLGLRTHRTEKAETT